MRLTFIILVVFGLLLSCNSNSTDNTRVSSDKAPVMQQSDALSIKSKRQLLVKELKELQSIIVSKDKDKIANIFQFPLSDKTVSIYLDDSIFNAQLKKNGDKITRAMFVSFFPQISESVQIDELNQLFKKLRLDSLLYKDTLDHEAYIKTEPCYHYYKIGIEKDIVTLTIGTNSNNDYISKSVSEDEIPENSSEFCEHALWWVFSFDGKRLHFKEISGAG